MIAGAHIRGQQQRTILVTGGTGYIGSHTCVALLDAGMRVHIVDNLSNSRRDVVERIERVAQQAVEFHHLDLRSTAELGTLLQRHAYDAVLHFAGLKAVGDSNRDPLTYYDVNVAGTLSLLAAMEAARVYTLVFSSSATVYGEPHTDPIREDHALAPINPYGRSKRMIETILEDLCAAKPAWRIAALRYFNPAGAHPTGLLGEEPIGTPNNLMPYVGKVLTGELPRLRIFGDDYDTPDGTAIRDYVHVMDLAQAHVCALGRLHEPGCTFVNIGTGRGYSVHEVIDAYQRVSGRPVAYSVADRRAGDAERCRADPAMAERWMDWRATRDLLQMCEDAWRFQLAMPRTVPAIVA